MAILEYQKETAGSIMSPDYVSLRREMTVEKALEKVRTQAPSKETIYTLYVTDESKILEGVVSLKDLILADQKAKVSDIMFKPVIAVKDSTDQEEVARLLQKHDFLAIPVIDSSGRMAGIVTVDDAMDVLEEEATEDLFKAGGVSSGIASGESVRSEHLVEGTLAKICRLRLPVLIIALIGGMLAAGVVERFEDILEAVAATAFFIPVIMDMGGSVGTQSATIFARGIVLGHIKDDKMKKHIFKETLVGLLIGIISGVAVGIISYIWLGMINLSIALSLAMMATMTLSAFLGFIVPFVLIKFKGDHATGSGPIITSIKDITGLLIYFGLVALFVGDIEPDYEITGMYATVDGVHFFIDMEDETAIVVGRENEDNFEIVIPEIIEVGDEEFEVIGIRNE